MRISLKNDDGCHDAELTVTGTCAHSELRIATQTLTCLDLSPQTGKTDTLNDPRWDYQLAVTMGYLPSTASAWNTSACSGFATS